MKICPRINISSIITLILPNTKYIHGEAARGSEGLRFVQKIVRHYEFEMPKFGNFPFFANSCISKTGIILA
jgi:hypothetical protein